MDKELYDWLKREFIYSNLPKYHKLFKVWVSNINKDQIDGFTKQMAIQKEKLIGSERWDIISQINLSKYKNMD